MSEFSREFLEFKGWENWQADFSILDIFKGMKEGETVEQICEGFGFTAIKKKNNQCILLYRNKEVTADEMFND